MGKLNSGQISGILLSVAIIAVVSNLFFVSNSVFGFAKNPGGKTAAGNATVGATTSYGLVFDNSGFNKLLEYDKTINVTSLTSEQQAVYKKLLGRDKNGKVIIPHPCCGVSISECAPCDHGKAIRGLIKYLLQQGWSEENILSESLVWDRLFFPGQV